MPRFLLKIPPALVFAFVLAGLCLLMYGRYLFGWLPIGQDNSLWYAPLFSLQWDDGPPLWNPYILSGAPLYDNLQSALLYPLRWPFFFIADWRDYIGLFTFLHYLLAFAGSWLFLRALKINRLPALAGSVVFAAGGHMAGRLLNPAIFYATCWLPWLLLGAAARRPAQRWIAALAFAMILMIGHPSVVIYGLTGYVVVLLFFASQIDSPAETSGAPGRNRFLKSIGLDLLRMMTGFALAAPLLVPGLLRVLHSVRTKASVAENLADSVAWRELPPIFLGGTGGTIYPEYIDKSCYLGPVAVVLILALFARRSSWRDRRVLCGLALSLAGVVLALGNHIGLQYIMPWIPGYRLLSGPPRALILTAMGAALLVALAFQTLPSAARSAKEPLVFGGAGLLSLLVFLLRSWGLATAQGAAPFTDEWSLAWIASPTCLTPPLFLWIDTAIGLLLACVVLLTTARHPLWRGSLLTALLFVQLWHFSPRVAPPVERRSFYDAPPAVAFLQAKQAGEGTRAPFRIATHDPLRRHDAEFDNLNKIGFLMPNLAALYGLEDLNGFDPMIHLSYLRLIEETSGRCPYNDAIRNLDIARPDARLFELLGVRYLLGHPYDRRMTLIPQTLDAQSPVQTIKDWPPKPEAELDQKTSSSLPAVSQWLFVSLIDGAEGVPLGTAVANLRIEAEEGSFTFPVRNGLDTAWVRATNFPPITRSPNFRATINNEFPAPIVYPDLDNRLLTALYRGRIEFGQPLHVRQVRWELLPPPGAASGRFLFHVAAQGYRLAPPAPAWNPWQLAFGHENNTAPVYEYTPCTDRAFLVASYTKEAGELRVDEAQFRYSIAPNATGGVQWLDRRTNSMRLRIHAEKPALLVFRELWFHGWKARLNGAPVVVTPVNGLWRGIEVPAGDGEITLIFRPLLPLVLLLLDAIILIIAAACLVFRRRRRIHKSLAQAPGLV